MKTGNVESATWNGSKHMRKCGHGLLASGTGFYAEIIIIVIIIETFVTRLLQLKRTRVLQ